MKKIVISQSNYIPWKGYFDAIATADEFVVFDDMQYTRRDWRNRNVIRTASGNRWLTIPVEVKGKYFQKINETRISDPNWNTDHWNLIRQAYAKSPNFKDYADFFESLYRNCRSTFLSEVNLEFLRAICEILGIRANFRSSTEFDLKEDRNLRLVDICQKLQGTDYYSGPAAKAYMDETLFEAQGIKVHYFDYSGYPEYRQMHLPFDPYVSIIDLMLCQGSQAIHFLKGSQ